MKPSIKVIGKSEGYKVEKAAQGYVVRLAEADLFITHNGERLVFHNSDLVIEIIRPNPFAELLGGK